MHYINIMSSSIFPPAAPHRQGLLFPTEPEWFAEERGVALGALAVVTINARGFYRFHINGYIW
jgi:hypothetical protein